MLLDYTIEQTRIFDFVKTNTGNGIIDAVAGAGKTATIMECAKFLPYQTDILFCAFNTSIANEIKEKFKRNGFSNFDVKTLHSLGRQLLVENNKSRKEIALKANKYILLLESDLINEKTELFYNSIIQRKRNKKNRDEVFDDISELKRIKIKLFDIIDKMRNTLTPENFTDFRDTVLHYNIFYDYEIDKVDFIADLKDYFECVVLILDEGNRLAWEEMVIDFTDMLYLPNKWNIYPRKQFGFMFIDECQDLSKSQLNLALRFKKVDGRILSVGDPKQSIYGFTGADINSFKNIEEHTNATKLELTSSFRCPQKVVNMAQMIRKDISSRKSDVGIVSEIKFEDVTKISINNSLIISRFKNPLYILALKFILERREINMHDDEIKELSNDLKNLFLSSDLNTPISRISDIESFLQNRVYTRISQTIKVNAEFISDRTEKEKYISSELLLLNEKLKVLAMVIMKSVTEFKTIREVIDNLKKYFSNNQDAIKLMSIHKSKGLESTDVFILDYDELPYKRATHKDWEKEQELNLKYVAITRSLQNLYLVKALG